ncbi:hypothetical protein [Streptomyces sp. NPDC091209]|uniref:hypothetical protein n=1 Tax=Streptomyces sp. NPDC091209 TaxID=3365974 RepID=UPI0037F9D490
MLEADGRAGAVVPSAAALAEAVELGDRFAVGDADPAAVPWAGVAVAREPATAEAVVGPALAL